MDHLGGGSRHFRLSRMDTMNPCPWSRFGFLWTVEEGSRLVWLSNIGFIILPVRKATIDMKIDMASLIGLRLAAHHFMSTIQFS